MEVLLDQLFGTANFYSANLRRLGHDASEIVANCRPVQLAWAEENDARIPYRLGRDAYRGIPLPTLRRDWFHAVLMAQVKAQRPDVIHFQAPTSIDPRFLRELRPYVRLVTGQIASPMAANADLGGFDLMLSSFPHFVRRFSEQGLRSAYFRLGFEPTVLSRLRPGEQAPVVFVGGLAPGHAERTSFLESIAARAPLTWWGYGVETLSATSPLRAAHRGPAWALAMYDRLFNARIALNHHIDVAENFANNMRLYEATGVGTLLLTDRKDNLDEIFDTRSEVVAYADADECVEAISHYSTHEAERAAIAAAGQRRTLREHTYLQRMEEFVSIVTPLLG